MSRFLLVEAANRCYGTEPARRVGDIGGVWVVFDTTLGGPPSSSHLTTTNRSLAELAVRALNGQKPASPVVAPGSCWHPLEAIYWNQYNRAFQCHRCGATADPSRLEALRESLDQEKGT